MASACLRIDDVYFCECMSNAFDKMDFPDCDYFEFKPKSSGVCLHSLYDLNEHPIAICNCREAQLNVNLEEL